MTHQELQDVYELFALGVLDGEEKNEVEQHLAQNCPECQAGVRRALAMGALFVGSLPEVLDPPKRLRARVLAGAGLEPKTSRFWLVGLSFVSACLLIAVALISTENTQRGQNLVSAQSQLRQSTSDLTRLQTAFQFLNQPATKQVVFGAGQTQPPQGRMFVNPQRGVLLIASNLPAPPSGKIYELWLIPKQGAPVPAGLFQSDGQGNALYLRKDPFDIAATKAVAVTLENEAGSNSPTSPVLIVAGISE